MKQFFASVRGEHPRPSTFVRSDGPPDRAAHCHGRARNRPPGHLPHRGLVPSRSPTRYGCSIVVRPRCVALARNGGGVVSASGTGARRAASRGATRGAAVFGRDRTPPHRDVGASRPISGRWASGVEARGEVFPVAAHARPATGDDAAPRRALPHRLRLARDPARRRVRRLRLARQPARMEARPPSHCPARGPRPVARARDLGRRPDETVSRIRQAITSRTTAAARPNLAAHGRG